MELRFSFRPTPAEHALEADGAVLLGRPSSCGTVHCAPQLKRNPLGGALTIKPLFCTAALLWGCRAAASPTLKDGDIIFQTSRSSQSVAIRRATHSRYSHMGLVLYRSGQPYVLEASSTVRYTPLPAWIARGVGGHYVVKRLADADHRLARGSGATV